jgi:hypothetical protein
MSDLDKFEYLRFEIIRATNDLNELVARMDERFKQMEKNYEPTTNATRGTTTNGK